MPTIVTGLYNINRESFGVYRRDWSDYLKWFENCLSLECNMVIFIEDSMIDFVKAHRSHLNPDRTKIIPMSLPEFRFYKYKEKMQSVMDSAAFKKDLPDPFAPEVTRPLYDIVTYSKISMLRIASDLNPFNSDYFIWLDAGSMKEKFLPRFKNIEFPIWERFKLIDKSKIYINCYEVPRADDLNLRRYFYTNPPGDKRRLTAFVIGSNKENIYNLEEYLDSFLNEILEQNLIDSEQIALNIYYLRAGPEKFDLFKWHPRTGWFSEFINLIERIKD